MGTRPADGIGFGQTTGDQFRTTPLWGLSFRTVYLHDGGATSVMSAIEFHSNGGGEAAEVIRNFNALSPSDRADLIAFLNSL